VNIKKTSTQLTEVLGEEQLVQRRKRKETATGILGKLNGLN
jgi:hypothetical protein